MVELAGCVITDEKGRVLLLHRNNGKHMQWEIPGGKIDKGESAKTAAIREVKEELGVVVEAQGKIGEKEFGEADKKLHYTWYAAKILSSQPKIAEPQTFDDLGYFSVSQMRRMFNDLSLGAQNYLSIIKE